MTVPDDCIDVTPGTVRDGASPCLLWMRFAFGPPIHNVAMGLDRLEAMLKDA